MATVPAPQERRGGADKRPKIPLRDRWTTILGHPLKIKATPAFLANEIISHNMTNEYTHILEIGTSGSGKSTLMQLQLHELHTRHPYQIHFFYKDEILDLKNIIKKLEKRVDHIIVFDDVSYLFKGMKPEQVEELMHQLTTIRHEVQARVISIFIIHYSYAILKGLRQADFRLITSMTDEEKENFAKVFGPSNRPLITKFADDYRFQTLYHRFYLPHPNPQIRQPLEYRTKEPFKLSLVSAMGKLRYMLFYKLTAPCAKCAQPSQRNLKPLDVNFVDTLIKKYGPNRVKRMARLVSFINTGQAGLQHTDQVVYNQLQKFVNVHQVNLLHLGNLLKDSKHVPAEEREEFIMHGLQKMASETLGKKHVEIPPEQLEADPADPEVHLDEAVAEYMTDEEIDEANEEAGDEPSEGISADQVVPNQGLEEEKSDEEDEDDDEPDFAPPPPGYSDKAKKVGADDDDDDEMFSGINFKDWS